MMVLSVKQLTHLSRVPPLNSRTPKFRFARAGDSDATRSHMRYRGVRRGGDRFWAQLSY